MNPAATILFPFAGKSEYAGLAIRSILQYSECPLGLVMTVEPGGSAPDEDWVRRLPAVWPGPLKIVRNEFRRGAYGSSNELVRQCPTEIGIWFTSDQVAGPGWDAALLKVLAPGRIVTGRLIESGATLIGDRTIWKRFGATPGEFDEEAFIAYCRGRTPGEEIDLPRHYIPMAFYVRDFVRAGLFGEGREEVNKLSTYREDLDFFLRCLDAGIELVEAQRCLTYHFQSGSKRTRRTMGGLLNWVYPLGLRPLHRAITGYEALIDVLEKKGARAQLERVRQKLRSHEQAR